jgi:cobalt-zinc-cadmium efflux system outer membrane protein
MRRITATALLALLLPFSLAATPTALVLQEDPPLPGDPITGWEALAPADARDGLRVEEAVEIALRDAPEIQVLRADLAAARGELIGARAVPNPVWDAEVFAVAADRTEKVPVNFGVDLELTEVVHAALQASAAAPHVDAARLRLDEAEIRIAYETRVAFYDHQAARSAWSASLRSVEALAVGRDAQRDITAAGNAPALDLALQEVAYEEARIRAAELELQVVATRERLARVLRQAPGTLADRPALPDLALPEDAETLAVTRSLELQALDHAILAADRRQTAAQVEAFAPDVGVFFESERRGAAWDATAGVELSVPLLAFGRGAILQAGAQADRLVAERVQAEIEVRSAARETTVRLESAWRRARHYDEVLVPARERVLRETLLQYNAMQVGLFELLTAWRALVDAEVAAADARREALTAQAALDALLAGARVDAPRASASTSSTPTASGGH